MFLLVPAYPGSPGQRAVKRLCVCVCGSGSGSGSSSGSMTLVVVSLTE